MATKKRAKAQRNVERPLSVLSVAKHRLYDMTYVMTAVSVVLITLLVAKRFT